MAAHYQQRLADLGRERTELATRDGALSRARGITFLLTAGAFVYALFRPVAPVWGAAAIALAVFVLFVVRHARLSTRQFELERRLDLVRRGLERLAGNYRAPEKKPQLRGEEYVDVEHPYTSDLDLFGHASLFEQLNITQTPGGAHELASWLRHATDPKTIRARQHAARELATEAALREDMALAGMRAGAIDRDARPFLKWAQQPHGYARANRLWVVVAIAVSVATWSLIACAAIVALPWTKAWLAALAVQVVLGVVFRSRVEPVVAPIAVKESPLGTYRDLLGLIEASSFQDAKLLELKARLMTEGEPASVAMRTLERRAGLANTRHNAFVALLANGFLGWDIWTAWLLDRWRERHGQDVARWLQTLSEMEALASIATFAFEHPDYAWPDIEVGRLCWIATDLGHPLIAAPDRVVNDVHLDEQRRALMISGSNMSGKSTMLRSIGVAAVLAQAGAPVCARALTMSPLRVFTSMRVGDDLDRGASRFYMEVRKLKRIVDAVSASDTPLLFLLDEVLHGTNSRERNIGAKAVVRHLVEQRTLGAISSHDLGLVQLEELTGGRVVNVHFEDHIENGAMCFDFRMKKGPVGTSNALRLMRDVGLDLPGMS